MASEEMNVDRTHAANEAMAQYIKKYKDETPGIRIPDEIVNINRVLISQIASRAELNSSLQSLANTVNIYIYIS